MLRATSRHRWMIGLGLDVPDQLEFARRRDHRSGRQTRAWLSGTSEMNRTRPRRAIGREERQEPVAVTKELVLMRAPVRRFLALGRVRDLNQISAVCPGGEDVPLTGGAEVHGEHDPPAIG